MPADSDEVTLLEAMLDLARHPAKREAIGRAAHYVAEYCNPDAVAELC
ncbi:MAG: hypothetical protein R3C44_14155 [Chloroflexota bacterium]